MQMQQEINGKEQSVIKKDFQVDHVQIHSSCVRAFWQIGCRSRDAI